MQEKPTEAAYRKRIQQTYDVIEKAFENADPDVVECEQSLGSMTITFADGTRCILSAQPSVRQLWVALASQGTAHHFNFDEASREWRDDKGKGIEVVSLIQKIISDKTRLAIAIQKPRYE